MSGEGRGNGYGEHGWGDPGHDAPPPGQQGSAPPWQGGPAPPWQGGSYGPVYRQEDHPKTVTAFVLSLVGLVGMFMCFLPVFLCIPGLVMGRQAKRDMQGQPGRYRNEGLATSAVVLGWIGVGLLAFFVVAMVVALVSWVGFGGLSTASRAL